MMVSILLRKKTINGRLWSWARRATSSTRDFLLETLKKEVHAIAKNVCSQLGKGNVDEITFDDLVSMCLQPLIQPLFGAIWESQAKGVHTGKTVTLQTVNEAIRAFAAMSFYQETPSNILDSAFEGAYPLVKKQEVQSFKLICDLLKSDAGQKLKDQSSLLLWQQPFLEDRHIRDTERSFNNMFWRLCIIPEVTIALTDDDQLRLGSQLVKELGIPRINNPKKVFGSVSTGCVSLTSRITCVMRLAG